MLHWGVMGLGNIAHRFVSSLAQFDETDFYAGASHNAQKREEFKEKYHPAVLYENYEEMLEDEDVDVVYIALPHGLHFKWVMESLKHGKCVLVEKPAFLTREEAITATTYAREHHLFFMEAMKTRFIPLIEVLHRQIEKGLIGDIVRVENYFTSNSMDKVSPDSYLFDQKMGGALYDVGVYNIASILDVIKSDVTHIENDATFKNGIDIHDKVTLTFANGATAYFECAIDDLQNKRSGKIIGTKGSIEMDYFYRPTSATVNYEGESQSVTRELDGDDFYSEIAAVHHGISYINYEAKRMSHQDTIDEVSLLEAIHEVTYGK
ncbi:Gfo/Idh/MocA family protein [uncultured Sharpea sp.]|uniref:Gfo/Idh/MocA family protein n=1 Tax=uncultured Sharpea sp. TaxID=1112738 RepID=UPI00258FF319|nr:Gfo/Idh/MocA family oxidoreductase [uncultured Sharpea sp.]